MNNILLLSLIGTIAVLIIASIVVYQFIQQQQALIKIDNIIKASIPTQEDNLTKGMNIFLECQQSGFKDC